MFSSNSASNDFKYYDCNTSYWDTIPSLDEFKNLKFEPHVNADKSSLNKYESFILNAMTVFNAKTALELLTAYRREYDGILDLRGADLDDTSSSIMNDIAPNSNESMDNIRYIIENLPALLKGLIDKNIVEIKQLTTEVNLTSTAMQGLFSPVLNNNPMIPSQNNAEFMQQVFDCAIIKYSMSMATIGDIDDKKYVDSDFSGYYANKIKGTNIIATKGPLFDRTQYNLQLNVAEYFFAVLFNKNVPIHKIIILGQSFDSDYFIADYFSSKNMKKMYLHYQVDATITSGYVDTNYSQTIVDGFVKSNVNITDTRTNETQNVTITVVPVANYSIMKLETGEINSVFERIPLSERLESLWQLYNDTQNENVLIHCTMGEGRTGHLILTFELMREYDRIFASGNPETIADEIMGVLNRIRESRPRLVTTCDQFIFAIKNAVTLHQYGLEKISQLQTSPKLG